MTPPAMSRREVLSLGGGAGVALLAPGALFATRPGAARSLMVLADPRYAESLSFADALERQGAGVRTIAPDIGVTWFTGVAPEVPRGLQGIAGLTLESDLFILERLAEGSILRTCYAGSHDWRCGRRLNHAVSGTVDLDPIAAALVDGNDRWAERLAENLITARDGSRSERKLALECVMASGRSPRFFVSWLMRWTA